jgi:hypothetical protein
MARYPLPRYAVYYWQRHIDNAQEEQRDMAVELLRSVNQFHALSQARLWVRGFYDFDTLSQTLGIHGAAELGLFNVCHVLLTRACLPT